MSSEARPHAKSRLASGWQPCTGASTWGGAQGMAGAQGCRCRALGHRGAQPPAAGTPNPPTLGGGRRTTGSWHPIRVVGALLAAGCREGGGTPHHRFLASPACGQRLTRRLLAAGQRGGGGGGAASPQFVGCREGGGGGAPQVLGVPCMPAAPHQEVVGGWAAGGRGGRPHHRLLAKRSGQGAGGNSRAVSAWYQGGCWPGERHRSRRGARAPARPGG